MMLMERKYSDKAILLFEDEDTYSAYAADADTLSQELGIMRFVHVRGIPVVSFANFRLDEYLRVLTSNGHRVAIVNRL